MNLRHHSLIAWERADNTFEEMEADLNRVGAPLEGLIRSTRKMPLEVGLALLVGILIGSVVVAVT